MKIKHVLECQFGNWYDKWRKHTIESEIIPLPTEFVSWLRDGEFKSEEFPLREAANEIDSDFYGTENEPSTNDKLFPELHEQINSAIKRLGGTVFPKLNWSSPQDASWMNFSQSLKCTESSDIILMLKSSNFIMHDITAAFYYCDDGANFDYNSFPYYLVLRKWKEIDPSSEFRCFVSHNRLIGITQRNIQYFPFLLEDKPRIKERISKFFENEILNNYPSHTFVFDVSVEKERVLIIDFNVFGKQTDCFLFCTEELFLAHLAIENNVNPDRECDFRIVDKQIHIQPSYTSVYGRPIDEIDVTSFDGMLELIRAQKEQEKEN